ncbi:MAG TPA: L-threonylcarbamoyladenylate synthase [Conexibacter sp.]|jgi:L-threonylcarbamoyladenylate synthase
MPPLTPADAASFAATLAESGVAVFPADTVYGLAAKAGDDSAIARLYALKGRAPAKPAATMWFDPDRALADLPPLGPRTRAALERLLPGAVTLLLPDPASPAQALGVRVPALSGPLAALRDVPHAVTQSSANLAGGRDPRAVEEVPQQIRDNVDLVLDAGPLPGTPSTVVDLRAYERDGTWAIVREGAVAPATISAALGN